MKKFKKEYIEAVNYVLNHPEWNNTKLSLYQQHCEVIDPNNKKWTSWDRDCQKCNLLNDLSKEDMLAILFAEFEIEQDCLDLLFEYKNENLKIFYNERSDTNEYHLALGVLSSFNKIKELGLKIVKVDE